MSYDFGLRIGLHTLNSILQTITIGISFYKHILYTFSMNYTPKINFIYVFPRFYIDF